MSPAPESVLNSTSPVNVTSPWKWKTGSVLPFAAKSPDKPVVLLASEVRLVIVAVPLRTLRVRLLSTATSSP